MAHLLGGEHLHVEFPAKVVLDDVTVGVDGGDRIGIVGRNGDGKSTLMKVLTGRLQPDSGRVTMRGGVRVGMLAQDDDLPDDETVRHAIVGDRPEHEWLGDARVRDVLDGLLRDVPLDTVVSALSGGQRRRVGLARLLVGDWDVIALDEPTNHLDVEGIAWLAEHLAQRWARNAGGLLLVTHDRWFLDAVCTRMWEVHDGTVDPFEGGYAAYVLQRVERQRQSNVAETKRRNILRKELAWLRRGAPARTSKPKFRIEAATQLIEDEPPPRDNVELAKLATARLGKDVVDLLDAGVDYGAGPILKDVEWRIAPGERTGILGPNGAGKSTLLGLVAGTVEPTSGRVKRGKTVKVATLSQRLTELDQYADERVRDVLALQKTSYVTGGKELTPTQLLERLGFRSSELSTPVRDLSGGQKRRLQLLLVLLDEPNVLILDEPSNDLDTDMLAALEDLLDSWPGTLLVVSHDRYLIERVTDQQYAIEGQGMRHLPGGVEEYLRRRAAARDAPAAALSSSPATGAGLAGADRRAAEKELSAIERQMTKLTQRIAAAHADLAAHDQSDYVAIGKRNAQLQTMKADLGDLEERWLELGESLGH
ncbi:MULTISPECIES: ABC-F family ATP-binding cassette domain-containing protein [unclassified Microbacterium]|uniref:ABC-F family ATP-binding cassette domain-containing protein n=1 Tax=unclassified Microbacterium TaxID=2609290 RepID=UPI00214B45C1|nr:MULTISPECIES: ABC-F family ATP-binding cassette domain-containing protein [unclassified Microbacterium]MCR2809651.1 ABC-F family ATP-binding cassette domain-containing protein [Microbacterium sp. zg.B185]WIM18025.1 ABC-F family ATP-binding cassette domain-containing protein [Microbacterium sp. zg-B185]